MPEKARFTVTGSLNTAESVAVTVATPPASAIGLPATLSVTVVRLA
ncbi:MAG: hypothetical protein WCO97_09605 [bacterium]